MTGATTPVCAAARVLALCLTLATLLSTLSPPATAATSSDPHLTESALSKRGSGRFADLTVTVGKTAHLGNEAVKVSWQWGGARPQDHATVSDTSWNYNYLQIFQCWGDSSGPRREQCQFGASYSAQEIGVNRRLLPYMNLPSLPANNVFSRVVSPVTVLGGPDPRGTDPLESADPLGYPARNGKAGVVPMHAAPTKAFPKGETTDPGEDVSTARFFDIFTSNEVPLARTSADGAGQVFFEMQTIYESQFLGCGERLSSAAQTVGRPCWLVVVPRDSIDVTGGDVASLPPSEQTPSSSPLALSNWQNRLQFPLAFDPVREACRIGGVERPIMGHESLSVAMTSWQPGLCASGQGFFYTGTTDDIARSAAVADQPKLSVVTDPVAAGLVPAGRELVYAPIAVSGVAVSLFIERDYSPNRPSGTRLRNGTRVEGLRLTPRLVAKLLTQSYSQSVWIRDGGPSYLRGNPLSLIDDPEFRQINQSLVGADAVGDLDNQRDTLAKLTVTADSSDAVRLVWEWVLADAASRDFLAGKPDPWGMVVNQFYKGLDHFEVDGRPRADIPRLDQSCTDVPIDQIGTTKAVCALDAAPYAASLDQAAALAARGQPQGFESFVQDAVNPTVFKPARPVPQLVGRRALLVLTDTPSADLRGLVSASLRNADGRYVAPTRESLAQALTGLSPTGIPGVQRVDPTGVRGSGYPLTRISYAVTAPAALDPPARASYALFVERVATDGQRPGTSPGTLPLGYAPLPGPLQVAAISAAGRIRTPSPTPSATTTTPATTSAPDPAGAPVLTGPPAGTALPGGSATAEPAPATPAAPGETPTATAAPVLVGALARTPWLTGTGPLLPAMLGLGVLLAGTARWLAGVGPPRPRRRG